MTSTAKQILAEQNAHLDLIAEARTLGIPTSLDDPRSPRTVDALSAAVTDAKA